MKVLASRDDIDQLPTALHDALLDRHYAEDLAEHAVFLGILAAVVSVVGGFAYHQAVDPSPEWLWAVVLGGVVTAFLVVFAFWQKQRVRRWRRLLADEGYDDSLMTEERYCNVYLIPKIRGAIQERNLQGVSVEPKYPGSRFRRNRDKFLNFLLFAVLPAVIGFYVAGYKGAAIGAMAGGVWIGFHTARQRDTD